jgi:hypothetical protein
MSMYLAVISAMRSPAALMVGASSVRRPQFLQAPVLVAGRPDAVGAKQRRDRCATLREPARVLLRRRWGAHILHDDAVLQYVQQRGHVFADAGFQQAQDPPVAAQLRDFPHDQGVDVRGYFGGAGGEHAGDI